MEKSKMSASLSASIMNKVATFHLRFGKRATCSFRTARMEVGKAIQDVVDIFRIMTFLHSAKDFPSVLRLYGIEDSRAYPNPNEIYDLRDSHSKENADADRSEEKLY